MIAEGLGKERVHKAISAEHPLDFQQMMAQVFPSRQNLVFNSSFRYLGQLFFEPTQAFGIHKIL